MIYESQGNKSKSLQFYLICALLDPKRFDDWPRLAEMSVDEENNQQAIMCLNKGMLLYGSSVFALRFIIFMHICIYHA